jgi:alpha-galactosidase
VSRIVIIGGGSYGWSPAFMRDIFTAPALRGSTVVLHDIDAGRLDLLHALGRKMIDDFALDARLEQTRSLDEALSGAAAVVLTITTGGLAAMEADLAIPARYGIRQSVGDTTGPGGLARALRNIPVVAAIGRRVHALCPDALFLNYTNPMSTLTRTLALEGVRVIGLCHEWHGVRDKLAQLFGVSPERIAGRVAGINHLIWLTGLWADGTDVWPQMPELAARVVSGELRPDADDDSVFADHARVKARLFQLYGALPAAGDRHVAEFFGSFINEQTGWGAAYDLYLTTVADRRAMEAEARGRIEAALRGDEPLAPFMAEPSGEAAAEILAAWLGHGRYQGILNLPNQGQISNLPPEVIVETEGVVDAGGARPVAFGPLPDGVAAVVGHHARLQEMTVRAGLSGDRALALQVLLNDPLSARLGIDAAETLLDELLAANERAAQPVQGASGGAMRVLSRETTQPNNQPITHHR